VGALKGKNMERIDLNVGFATRVAAERLALTTSEDIGEHDGKVCPGTNIKPDDDVLILGTVVRVLGGKTDDPASFYCAWMDWSIPNSFTVGSYPCGDYGTPYITDRAPVDPEDEDPIYIEPEQGP
jgi:hypothetical protein